MSANKHMRTHIYARMHTRTHIYARMHTSVHSHANHHQGLPLQRVRVAASHLPETEDWRYSVRLPLRPLQAAFEPALISDRQVPLIILFDIIGTADGYVRVRVRVRARARACVCLCVCARTSACVCMRV
jgi:hypothetical protein